MKPRILSWLAVVVDLALTGFFWAKLPEVVPTHWNLRGEVDATGSKLQLLVVGPALLVGLMALLEVLRRIDPKNQALAADAPAAEAGTTDLVISVVMWFLVALHLALLLAVTGAPSLGPLLLAVAFAGFQLFLGNMLPRVRPNFFVGIRTPWTLASDTVWRRTHRVAGKLLVGGGVLSLATLALAPTMVAFPVTVGAMVVALLGPSAASYLFWRSEQRAGQAGR